MTAEAEKARFSPTWDAAAAPAFEDLAYGVYRLSLNDYLGSPTVELNWDTPPTNTDNLYVGFSDWGKDNWQWYKWPMSFALEIPAIEPYIAPSGTLLVAVVLLGTDEAVLNWLRVGDNIAPSAALNADPTEGDAPLLVNLDASASSDLDGTVVQYEWDWDSDGIYDLDAGSTPTVQHTFVDDIGQACTLRVTDDDGSHATAQVNLVMTNLKWVHSWGGSAGDGSFAAAVDSLGNIWTAGWTSSYGAGNDDSLLCKYNPSGTLLLAKTWGGDQRDDATLLLIDDADNVYVGGYSDSFVVGDPGYPDVFLLKYNSTGVLQWQRSWGGSANDVASAATFDASGNVLLAGYTGSYGAGNPDSLLLKYDTSGNLIWQKTWGGAAEDASEAVALGLNGDVFLSGYTTSYGAGVHDVMLLKYDSAGTIQWVETWGGAAWDYADSLAIDGDGNVWLAGQTANFGAGQRDVLLMHYSPSGALLNVSTWGGSGTDAACSVFLDSMGNLLLSGFTDSFGASAGNTFDALVLKYDSLGSLLWTKTWGATTSETGICLLVANGDLYAAGSANSASGDLNNASGSVEVPGGTQTSPIGTSMNVIGTETEPDGTITSPAGTVDTGGGGDDTLLMRYSPP